MLYVLQDTWSRFKNYVVPRHRNTEQFSIKANNLALRVKNYKDDEQQ